MQNKNAGGIGKWVDNRLSNVGSGIKHVVSGIIGGTVGAVGGFFGGALAGPFVGGAQGAEKGWDLPDKLWAPESIIGKGLMVIPKLACGAVGLVGGAVAGQIAGPFIGTRQGAKKGFNTVKESIEAVTEPKKLAQNTATSVDSHKPNGFQKAFQALKKRPFMVLGVIVGSMLIPGLIGVLLGAYIGSRWDKKEDEYPQPPMQQEYPQPQQSPEQQLHELRQQMQQQQQQLQQLMELLKQQQPPNPQLSRASMPTTHSSGALI